MSKKKTIFDLFRENDSNFSAQPSQDAWAKLERKLDGNSKIKSTAGGKMIRMNYFAVAASLAIAVGFGALFFIQNMNTGNKSFAFNDSARPLFVEDLILTDADARFEREWAVANDYRARFSGYPADSYDEAIEYIADAAEKIQPNRINKKPGKMIALNEEPSARKQLESISDKIQEDLMVDSDNSSIRSKRKAAASGYSDSKNLVSNLNWLVGNWEQKLPGMKSVEKWVSDTFNTISGEGFLVQGDDTVFTEKMAIKQIGDKVYFFQNMEETQNQIPFVMTVQSDTQWIFENHRSDFPEEVILSNSGGSNYRYEMREVSTSSNAAYLRQRNAVLSKSAKRNMTKLN